jgi:choline dehydrogenase-like flavoprotein
MTPQTAGLCIATRLTENPDVQVLVLEAGGTNLDEKDLDVLRASSL